MKKITSEEFDKLNLHGRGSSTPFYNQIMALKPGDEALIIEKKEWHVKYLPTSMVNRIAKKYNRKFKAGSLPDRSGWGIKRLE